MLAGTLRRHCDRFEFLLHTELLQNLACTPGLGCNLGFRVQGSGFRAYRAYRVYRVCRA